MNLCIPCYSYNELVNNTINTWIQWISEYNELTPTKIQWIPLELAFFNLFLNTNLSFKYGLFQRFGETLFLLLFFKMGRAEHRRHRFRVFVLFHCGGRMREENLPHWPSQIPDDLQYWCTYNAWSFCSKCHTLLARKLTPSFRNRRWDIYNRACTCQTDGYVPHSFTDIPHPLRHLTWRDVCVCCIHWICTCTFECPSTWSARNNKY